MIERQDDFFGVGEHEFLPEYLHLGGFTVGAAALVTGEGVSHVLTLKMLGGVMLDGNEVGIAELPLVVIEQSDIEALMNALSAASSRNRHVVGRLCDECASLGHLPKRCRCAGGHLHKMLDSEGEPRVFCDTCTEPG